MFGFSDLIVVMMVCFFSGPLDVYQLSMVCVCFSGLLRWSLSISGLLDVVCECFSGPLEMVSVILQWSITDGLLYCSGMWVAMQLSSPRQSARHSLMYQ